MSPWLLNFSFIPWVTLTHKIHFSSLFFLNCFFLSSFFWLKALLNVLIKENLPRTSIRIIGKKVSRIYTLFNTVSLASEHTTRGYIVISLCKKISVFLIRMYKIYLKILLLHTRCFSKKYVFIFEWKNIVIFSKST